MLVPRDSSCHAHQCRWKSECLTPTHGGALSCARAGEGDVVISEVMLDGEPTESEEFIEIVNVSDEPIRLNGLSIWAAVGSVLCEESRSRAA